MNKSPNNPHYPCKEYINRQLDIAKLVAKKSYFLFGPRQTGKTSLIKHTLSNQNFYYNLLSNKLFLELSNEPERLSQEVHPKNSLVTIDEIQRLPELLNSVHDLIESKNIRFLLTGSSARKLRRAGVNLLGGRARTQYLHPFTAFELKKHFDLNHTLNYGLIPSIYFF